MHVACANKLHAYIYAYMLSYMNKWNYLAIDSDLTW